MNERMNECKRIILLLTILTGPEFFKIIKSLSFDLSQRSEQCDWLRV